MTSRNVIYVNDIVARKSDPSAVGIVGRTHTDADDETSGFDEYEYGIEKDDGVSSTAYSDFVASGIPPRDTVVVNWFDPHVQFRGSLGHTVIPCDQLIVIDRHILVGDVVKAEPKDAQSGVVTSIEQKVTLLPQAPWPGPTERFTYQTTFNYNAFDARKEGLLKNISTSDICRPSPIEGEDMVYYQGYVGRVIGIHSDISLQFSSGAVVQVDADDDGLWSGVVADGTPRINCDPYGPVGSYLNGLKGTFRRGKWIYGSYNANQQPTARIIDTKLRSIEVHWLATKVDGNQESRPMPPIIVEGNALHDGSLVVYDPTVRPSTLPTSEANAYEVDMSDPVRFKDFEAAVAKYSGRGSSDSASEHINIINKIPRTSTLGFDVNVFCIGMMSTSCTVAWQDGTTTTSCSSLDIVPCQDLDSEENFYPGEHVIPKRASSTTVEEKVLADKIGVVQTVDAEARIAHVKWMKDTRCTFLVDHQEDNAILIPGSYTGPVSDETEEVSLYDIQTLMSFNRRLGDFVHLLAPLADDEFQTPAAKYVAEILREPNSKLKWFGEVVGLGLDGLLTVRLGAADVVEDVKVPMECAMVVYSTDWSMADDHSGMSLDSEDASLDSLDGTNDDYDDEDAGWVDENDREVAMDDEEWESEDSVAHSTVEKPSAKTPKKGDYVEEHADEDVEMNIDTQGSDTSKAEAAPELMPEFPLEDHESSPPATSLGDDYKIEGFMILESGPPADHIYRDSSGSKRKGEAAIPFARINKEHKILRSSLPPGIYVRTWESSLDLIRVLIIGPLGTPYEYAPFMFDLLLDETFPSRPPQIHFHSWTKGMGRVNPNLYEDGKVCLSLLGTWSGDRRESWSAAKSTILQILVSLLGLVLVKEPYYNEAGFEARAGTDDSTASSLAYTERAFFMARSFIVQAIQNPPEGFSEEITHLYLRPSPRDAKPGLLLKAVASALLVRWSSACEFIMDMLSKDGGAIEWPIQDNHRFSAGAVIPLKRQIEELLQLVASNGNDPNLILASYHASAPSGVDRSTTQELFKLLMA